MAGLDRYRPIYHFTAPQQWLNDPNGLVYASGAYHLFYQYHPDSDVWGPMHWGHARSRDLVRWEHLPIALYPDEHGMIFSGSALVDWQNTAGFGAGALVAFFTHHGSAGQSQSLAFSTDAGQTWQKHAGNPLLAAPAGLRDFRDPKVFWYGEPGAGHWVMVLSAATEALFYTSQNLLDWQLSGRFGQGYDPLASLWETPDLFRLTVEGEGNERWVLAAGFQNNGPAGGSGTRYFVGTFDGQAFTADEPPGAVYWADFGADFYAAQSWSDEPLGRRIWLAWMSNWQYANVTPTSGWRGAMSLPRQLSLARTSAGLRLRQRPIAELASLRGASWRGEPARVQPGAPLALGLAGPALEIIAELEPSAGTAGLRLITGAGEQTLIGYSGATHELFVDRSQSGPNDFSPTFAGRHSAALVPDEGRVRLQIFIDRSSVEVFGGDGLATITDQIFPSGCAARIELFAEGAPVWVHSLEVFQLDASSR